MSPTRFDTPASVREETPAGRVVEPGSRLEAPSITSPKGGGAIRGIDEKFQVNSATGSGAMTIPIGMSAARSGFGPQLALGYDSASGNGPFGFGWSLSTPGITRKTDKGLPRYEDGAESDVFLLSGAEDLVPVVVGSGEGLARHSQSRIVDGIHYRVERYRPRIEGLFARIERWTNRETGTVHWRSISRDNVTTLYGRTAESRIADPADAGRIFSWLICESFDDKGNAILYRYKAEDSANASLSQVHERNRTETSRSANRYLKRILYGNRTPRQPDEDLSTRTDWMFEAVLDYGENHLAPLDEDGEGRRFAEAAIEEQRPWPVRQDPVSSYRAAFEVRTYRLCRRFLMFHHFPDELGQAAYLVRATHFQYDEGPIHTEMSGVFESGYLRQDDGRYQEQSLPAVEFEYSRAEIQSEVHEMDRESLENLPAGLAGSQYQWVDLDGEGISGILTEQGGGWFYKANLGNARFAPIVAVQEKPSLADLSKGQQLIDLAGDGQLDLVTLGGPTAGFYERTEDGSWSPYRAFESVPPVAPGSPNVRFVDLTGDGHADILVTEDEVFTWYASLAEEGFDSSRRNTQPDDEELGPRLVFSDGSQSIYLADMSGDGLIDLVRIRNGEVSYWPNLGYGNFGAKVTMDNAPWFDLPGQFDQRRIRLGDVDGSGITDILYLEADQVAVYFNQAGNGWSDAQRISHAPQVDNLSDVTVTDLFGNGTACLVWSSPTPGNMERQMRYIDLMGGVKPHLMIGSRNNLGAETRIHYAASTRFYLEDKAAGHPWITRLPFPVHVVERTETFDHVSRNRFVSRYRYHHGFFDGVEREFRGFGMVEQIDTEEFAALNESGEFPTGDNIDETSHVPPILTRTWFHTGAYLGRQRVSNYFAGLLDEEDSGEYYREPGLTEEQAARLLLPDTILPQGLTVEEEREACRALKGTMLRQEVYAADGTPAEPHPYMVSEQNFTIRVLQRRGDNRHAVFFTHSRESLNYHYERDPGDPRVSHALTLATDDFGNVLRSAAIGYGRREPDAALAPADQVRQSQILMTCTERAFTNAVEQDDVYRAPRPSETMSFELTGLAPGPGQIRFAFAEIDGAVQTAETIAYHQAPSGSLERRLIEHTHTLYRPDDLGAEENDPQLLLAPGVLEPLALTGESYQLAFTPEHVALVFGDRVNEPALGEEGRYVHFAGDDNWWIPSGRAFFSGNEADTAAEELAVARQHFYMPVRFRDAFGNSVRVEYDAHDLLVQRTIDPLDNTVAADHDYRLLVPRLVTDPNGNRSAIAFDVLGAVAGTAAMGKETETAGDSLEGFQAQLTQAQIDAFFADPRGPIAAELLGNATSRFLLDETRFQRLGLPVFTANIGRETHVSDLGPGEQTAVQVSLEYSDGFGRSIQSKTQAEAGPVVEGGPEVSRRWTASGWTIFNNKGKPVRRFEPFFSAEHAFEFGVTVGVSPTLLYDPAGRVVATLYPNHTWEKVSFNPWRQESWDVNDTVLSADPSNDPEVGAHIGRIEESEFLPTWHQMRVGGALGGEERDAAQKAAAHAETPAILHFDSLGRPFLSIADNGPGGRLETRTEYDIEGNPLRIIDARGNVVMDYQVEDDGLPAAPGYDVAGRRLFENSMDCGERRMLPDAGGKPLRRWDARGHMFRAEYDALHRLERSFVTGADPGDTTREILFERTVYGEALGAGLNHRGKVFQVFDGAGLVTNEAYDFKGTLLRSSRQLLATYRDAVDWSAGPLLEPEVFFTELRYDALSRPVAITGADGSVTIPAYNEANLLEQMAVRIRGAAQATLFVANLDYNARGQRERIEYATTDGANFSTTYQYDLLTFRLTRLNTVRHADGRSLQDLNYAYDPVGNITSIRDNAQQTVFFGNVQVEPHSGYSYDALYRLIQAEGREHAVQNSFQRDAGDFEPILGMPFPNSPEAMQRYVENYAYDESGNILSMRHTGGAVQRWSRRYQYAAGSNRLLGTSLPADNDDEFSATYTYDSNGNMTGMPHLPGMEWNFKNQLHASSRQVVNNGGVAETTYYVYSLAGERVRKVTEGAAAPGATAVRRHERIYAGGIETYREYGADGSTVTLERQTLHVMDDRQRIAQADTRTLGNDGAPAESLRFQLSNHLGSAALEVDEQADVVSYEEYHPYGTTAYRAARSQVEASLKRFRFTGKELDEETDLYDFGARPYAAWLGRWVTVDPIGVRDGVNQYAYVRGNPVRRSDANGMQAYEKTSWGAYTVGVHSPIGRQQTKTYEVEAALKEERQLLRELKRVGATDAELTLQTEIVEDLEGEAFVERAVLEMAVGEPGASKRIASSGISRSLAVEIGTRSGKLQVAQAKHEARLQKEADERTVYMTPSGNFTQKQLDAQRFQRELNVVTGPTLGAISYAGGEGVPLEVAEMIQGVEGAAGSAVVLDPGFVRGRPEVVHVKGGPIRTATKARPRRTKSGPKSEKVKPEPGAVQEEIADDTTAKEIFVADGMDPNLPKAAEALAESARYHKNVNYWPKIESFIDAIYGRSPANDVRLHVVKEVANDPKYPKHTGEVANNANYPKKQ